MRAQLPPPPTSTPAEAAAQQALDMLNAGQTAEATAAYEKILKDYPTAMITFEAQFRLGYLYFLNGDYDKSIERLKKITQPPAPPEIQELAYSFLPQVATAKASKLPPESPQRKAAFEDAVKQYDTLIQKYPTSEQMENFIYGKAVALYQGARFDDAVTALRSNLTKFPQSESILDSQYLLAITLATQAATILQAAPNDQQGVSKYDEAAKLFGEIIQKRTDVALANDAQFQLGEVLVNRAAAVDKASQAAAYNNAITAFRAVEGRDPMVKAQQDRIAGLLQRLRGLAAARNVAAVKHFQRLMETEQGKLNALKTKPDQSLPAKIKIAQVFYDMNRYDEARVMLHDLQQLAEDDAQKKLILYFITLTYAGQNDADKAVASYTEFNTKYKNDPIAENLPIVMGGLFLNPASKANDPNKAIQYFKDEVKMYPKGRFISEALTRQAAAMVQLKRFDEALASFKSLIAANPSREISASAQLGIGSILTQTGKLDEALAAFKTVCDKYPDTEQAEQAAYYLGQIAVQKGDNKAGIANLTQFITKYPNGTLTPSAMFYLAGAEQASGNSEAALAKYKEIPDKFPQSEVAPFTYFQRAQVYASMQKMDEIVAVMREFIAKYPESDKIFFAYDSIAQNQVNASHLDEAIATYEEFVTKYAQNPQAPEAMLKISGLWRRIAEAPGRYLVLNEEQRAVWIKALNSSLASAEKLLEQYPGSPQVALALQTLLADQRLLLTAKLKTDAEVEQYFQDLAKKLDSNPAAKSKVLFTLASYIYEKDKAKALAQMNAAYNTKLVYAPADLDLYGSALLEQNKGADAKKVYEKLAADYPVPAGLTPDKAPADIAEAQSISLYGIGKCLQQQGDTKGAGESFDNLKKWYPWSPKILEANFGIAQSLYQQKKYDDAINLLIPIMRAQSASVSIDLRAQAMLLGGRIQEDQNHLEQAIDYYIKIASFYEGVPTAAAEGLWRGGQLLEKQAAGLQETGKVTKSGQLAKAAKAYKDLVEKYPSSPFADQASKRRAALKP